MSIMPSWRSANDSWKHQRSSLRSVLCGHRMTEIPLAAVISAKENFSAISTD